MITAWSETSRDRRSILPPIGGWMVVLSVLVLLAPSIVGAQQRPKIEIERERPPLHLFGLDHPRPAADGGNPSFETVASTSTTISDLRFDALLAGQRVLIAPGDWESAAFRIVGQTGQQVEIVFADLPSELDGPAGDGQLAVFFDGTSAAWSYSDDPSAATRFDPRSPIRVTLVQGNAEIYLWLGAEARPAADQPSGSYHGQVTISVDVIQGPGRMEY